MTKAVSRKIVISRVKLSLWDQCSVLSRSPWWWEYSWSICRSHSRVSASHRTAGWVPRRWRHKRVDRSTAGPASASARTRRRWRRAWWRRRRGSRRWSRRGERSCLSTAAGPRGRRLPWPRPASGSPSPDTCSRALHHNLVTMHACFDNSTVGLSTMPS